MTRFVHLFWAVLLLALTTSHTHAQALLSLGLRSQNSQGAFKAAQYLPDGSLVLLYDQGDGLRLLKADRDGAAVLAQAQEGAAGDTGVALALDPAGNIYVAGTSLSGTLQGTQGTAFPTAADGPTNSFIAKFDSSLHLQFLTFLGASRTVVTGISATTDAVFVTGSTYSQTFPVTVHAAGTTPAGGVHGSGFVQRFASDTGALVYATYLCGMSGDTSPTAIAADTGDQTYIAGETSAGDLPITSNALQPVLPGTAAGFVAKLNADGSSWLYSSFVAGAGLTGLALDPGSQTLLLSGSVSFGQLGIATASTPLAAVLYQAMLRLTLDGQQILNSALLLPGTQSFLQPAPDGTVWVAQTLSTPLFPPGTEPLQPVGDSVLLHLSAAGTIKTAYRFGGNPRNHAAYASLATQPGIPALRADGGLMALPASLNAITSSLLEASQAFDLPLIPSPQQTASSLLQSPGTSLLPDCSAAGQCLGSAGLLGIVASSDSSPAMLSLSTTDAPNLLLRNVGAQQATDVTLNESGFQLASDCPTDLDPGSGCSIALTGSSTGSFGANAANAPPLTVSLPAGLPAPSALAFSTPELDFGIVVADEPTLRTITVTNLTSSVQSFASAPDGALSRPAWSLTEASSTCAGPTSQHTIPANSQCTVSLALAGLPGGASTVPVHAYWALGVRDVLVTGVITPAAITLSAEQIDFGVRYPGLTPMTSRFLFLANNSSAPVPHAPVNLSANTVFSVADGCPTTLEPGSLCQMVLSYTQSTAPNLDAITLSIDGHAVLVTGEVLPEPSSAQAASSLVVTPPAITFVAPTSVATSSTESQAITIQNAGALPVPLQADATGDFSIASRCPTSLAAGATCTLLLQFLPTQPGTRDGLLTLGSGPSFAPVYVPLSGTATGLLPSSVTSLDLGESPVAEPATAWFPVQGNFPALHVQANGQAFAVALAAADGVGAPSLPPSAFGAETMGACAGCLLGVRFLPQSAGLSSGSLIFTSSAGGRPYMIPLEGTGIAVSGLAWDKPAQDFGTVPLQSTSASFAFVLANQMSPAGPVTLEGIAATGDFQIASNSTGGADCTGTLLPGASCFVELVFHPSVSGLRTGTLQLNTSAGPIAAILTGTGSADPGLALQPTSVQFQAQPGSSATQATVTITNTGNTVATLSPWVSSTSAFTITGSPCTTLAPGAQCQVTLVYTPAATLSSGQFTFMATSGTGPDAVTTNYSIPVTARYTAGSAALLLLPAQANFAPQATGITGVSRTFTLTNLSTQAESVSLRVPQQFPLATPFSCASLAPGASCSFSVLPVMVNGGAAIGSLTATATLANRSSAQTISYLLGYGQAQGTLSITGPDASEDRVSFAQVSSGITSSQTLSLTNSGTGTLNIHRITSDPPFFATTDCVQALAPRQACSVSLTYAPVYQFSQAPTTLAPRQDTGTLQIESDANSSPDQVNLTGSVAPTVSAGVVEATTGTYTLSQGALSFPNVAPGNLTTQRLIVTNTGGSSLHFAASSSSGDFNATSGCGTLPQGASCAIDVTFAPTSAPDGILRLGVLELSSDATDALEFVSLLGESAATPLAVTPGTLAFAAVAVGTTATLPLTITNTSTLPLSFTTAFSAGAFTTQPGDCPAQNSILTAGQSCTLQIVFAPVIAGKQTGTIQITSSSLQAPIAISTSGIGLAPQIAVNAQILNFGAVPLGSSNSLSLTVTNPGSAALPGLHTSLSGPNAPSFVTADCDASVQPGASCTLSITFSPTSAGQATAALTVEAANAGTPVTISLAGAGLASPGFSLSVNGSSSANASVSMGTMASYPLLLTPKNGFTGPVALTCTAITAGPNAACSLLGSQMSVTGADPQKATAEITTVSRVSAAWLAPIGLLSSGLLLTLRRRYPPRSMLWLTTMLLCLLTTCAGLTACSSGGGSSLGLRITPPGTYQYRVTASSTDGAPISASVLLNLTVH